PIARHPPTCGSRPTARPSVLAFRFRLTGRTRCARRNRAGPTLVLCRMERARGVWAWIAACRCSEAPLVHLPSAACPVVPVGWIATIAGEPVRSHACEVRSRKRRPGPGARGGDRRVLTAATIAPWPSGTGAAGGAAAESAFLAQAAWKALSGGSREVV